MISVRRLPASRFPRRVGIQEASCACCERGNFPSRLRRPENANPVDIWLVEVSLHGVGLGASQRTPLCRDHLDELRGAVVEAADSA